MDPFLKNNFNLHNYQHAYGVFISPFLHAVKQKSVCWNSFLVTAFKNPCSIRTYVLGLLLFKTIKVMLFEEVINLNMKDADVIYYPRFFNNEISDFYFKTLLTTLEWQHDTITLFGKTHLQPRLTALYANNKHLYTYSNITMHPKAFTKDLLQIKEAVNKEANTNFTSCLANLYRNGNDSNGWHADNEKELGEKPIIASVTFGAERIFHFKHKYIPTLKTKLILKHGSLLIMKGSTQKYWLHQLPKTKKKVGERINLTFRIIA